MSTTDAPGPSAAVKTPERAAANSAPAAEQKELIDIECFAKIQLRVGRVEHAEAVAKSKKLLKLQVSLGPECGKRQILAGIAQFYSPESLIGKQIVIVANLKPATLMGLESQGMLLAASNSDGSSLFIVAPESQIDEGSTVR